MQPIRSPTIWSNSTASLCPWGPFATLAFFDTIIAVLAGLIIFPALFAAGGEPGGGAGLVFVVLPTIFLFGPAGLLIALATEALTRPHPRLARPFLLQKA